MTITEYLHQYSPVPGYDWSDFTARLHHKELSKGAHLIVSGEKENRLYFLEEGIIRFYIEKENKDITFDFSFSGSFFCAFSSFLTGEPVQYSIQALTHCSLLFIEKSELEQAYQASAAGLAMGKWSAEQQFLKKSARELSLLTQTAEERYISLMELQPGLLEKIPLKYLASYIGITPQALSRIRRRLAQTLKH